MGYYLGMPIIYGQTRSPEIEPLQDIASFKKWFDLQNLDFAMVYIDDMWEVHAVHRTSGKIYSGEPCELLTRAIYSAYELAKDSFKKEGIPLHANIRPISEL